MGLHVQLPEGNQATAVRLTEHAVKLPEESMQLSNHQLVLFTDHNRASVLLSW